MRNLRFLLLWLLCSGLYSSPLGGQTLTGTDILKKMHSRYYLGPCKSYTFSQNNTHYRNDSITGKSNWYEAIEFPDKFTIWFGDMASGNVAVFRNDSLYRYKANTLVKARRDSNNLLLVLGGMYYRSFEDVSERMKKAHYNLGLASEQIWNGEAVYVIGAKENDLASNQLWIDKKKLLVVRIIEGIGAGSTMDMRFEAHTKMCNGFIESKVSFRRDGKLEQEETYFDIMKTERFPDLNKK